FAFFQIGGFLKGFGGDVFVAFKVYRGEKLLFFDDEDDDNSLFGGLDLGLNVGKTMEVKDALIIFFDGGRVEALAFARADDVEDDGSGNGVITHDADSLDGPARKAGSEIERRGGGG